MGSRCWRSTGRCGSIVSKKSKSNPYAALERAVDADDKEAAQTAMALLTDLQLDLLIKCPACGAAERVSCVGKPKVVCFGRRLKRLLEGIK